MEVNKHLIVAVIFLIFLTGIMAVAVFIWLKSRKEGDAHRIKEEIYKIRLVYFVVLMAVILIFLSVTLSILPYPNDIKASADFTVSVVGHQWFWNIAKGDIKQNGVNFNNQDSLVVPAHEMIEFQVTSDDVNHDFGLYDSQGRLLAQTQAMPGYVNDLKYEFIKPGTYHIVCLEYCGLAHQIMHSEISVK